MISIFMFITGGMVGAIFGGLGGSLFGAIAGLVISIFPDTDGQDDEDVEIFSYSSLAIMDNTDIDTEFGDFHINPATGLPMLNGSTGFDVGGNPFGTDLSSDDSDSMLLNEDTFDDFSDPF